MLKCRQRDAPLAGPNAPGPPEDRVEDPPARDDGQEPAGGLLEGGAARHDLQADRAAQVGVVDEVPGGPPVVQAEQPLEHQAGEELVLSELLEALLVPRRRQRLAGGVVGDLQDPREDLLVVPFHTTTPGAPRLTGFLQSRT